MQNFRKAFESIQMKLWTCVFTVNTLYQNVKSAFCLKYQTKYFVCWTWAEVSFFPFLLQSWKLAFCRKVPYDPIFPLRSSNVLLPILLIIVKNRPVLLSALCTFFLKEKDRLYSVNHNVSSQQLTDQQFPTVIIDATLFWPKAGIKYEL